MANASDRWTIQFFVSKHFRVRN